MQPEQIRIVAGPHHRQNIDLATFISDLEEIRLHENFSRSSLENNIAVGVLSIPILKNDPMLSVLDLEDIAIFPPVEGAKCKIFGWSLTTRSDMSPNLLSGDVLIESKEKCDVNGNKVTSTSICAGPIFINGCETDSGGPLTCQTSVFALIDYREPYFCSKVPVVLGTYVGLAEYHSWIADQTDGAGLIGLSLSAIFISTAVYLMRFAS